MNQQDWEEDTRKGTQTTKTASLDHYDIEEEAARKLKPKMK